MRDKRVKIAFNGKFLAASMTGVHRVAEELILALDHLITSDPKIAAQVDAVILVPPSATRTLPTATIRTKTVGFLSTYYWEQFDLPRHVGDRLLVNLCNLGPFSMRHAITMIHDAQVYSTPESYSFMFRTLYRLVLPIIGFRHQSILTVSNFSKAELSRFGVVTGNKVTVIHNGADHVDHKSSNDRAASDHGLTKNGYVLALANAQRHKNIQILFEAFQRLGHTDLRLVLYGSAKKGDFEAIDIAVPENVTFVGRIDDADLMGLIDDALCLGFPSLTEGFGLPPLEAMRLGCPVVAAPCGALPEICGDAVLYADPHDAEKWVLAFQDLLTHAELREKLATMGIERSRAFSWEQGARQLLSISEEISTGSSKRQVGL